jgi:hypothetical protein
MELATNITKTPMRHLKRVEYLQPRIASVFQRQIGLTANHTAAKEIALLGSIIILNRYAFTDIELPVKGHLKISAHDSAGDLVAKGHQHFEELLNKLREFQSYLKRKGYFHDAASSLSRYLSMLDSSP